MLLYLLLPYAIGNLILQRVLDYTVCSRSRNWAGLSVFRKPAFNHHTIHGIVFDKHLLTVYEVSGSVLDNQNSCLHRAYIPVGEGTQ